MDRADRHLHRAAAPVHPQPGAARRAVLTNQRIVCDYEGSRFDYHHEYLTGLGFAIEDWTIDLTYEGVDPIRLVGLDSFAYGLLLTWLRAGPDALAGPGFEPFQGG
jgi:hypothetical protein